MSLAIRQRQTATGRAELIIGPECDWDAFPARAQQVVDLFGMTVHENIDGIDVRMWITAVGDATFCVSWDIWLPEVSVMAWRQTPEAAVARLLPPRDRSPSSSSRRA